jgi:hypothetical protein
MQHAHETLLSVVVLELGSSWPPWLVEYRTHAPNSIVIAQSADESGHEFAQRIRRKVDEIAGRDAAIHAALLVCNGALDEGSIVARQRICSSLLRVMLQKQRGELVLAGDVAASDDVRHELFALAGTLCDELGGSDVSVRVRFDTLKPGTAVAAPGASGVMRSAVRSAPDDDLEADSERTSNGSR